MILMSGRRMVAVLSFIPVAFCHVYIITFPQDAGVLSAYIIFKLKPNLRKHIIKSSIIITLLSISRD